MEAKFNKWLKRLGRLAVVGASAYGVTRAFAYHSAVQSREEFERTPAAPSMNLPPGSLVFFTHNCSKSFSYEAAKSCLIHQAYKSYVSLTKQTKRYRQSEFDSVGVIVHSQGKPHVLLDFFGECYDLPLSELLRLPFLQTAVAREFVTSDPSISQTSSTFRDELLDLYWVLGNSFPFTRTPFRDSVDLVLNFWVKTGVVDTEVLHKTLKQTIRDLDTTTPHVIAPGLGTFADGTKLK